jgi:putative Ca2+/H+ antiporter (TMEM165/GDT1 family)
MSPMPCSERSEVLIRLSTAGLAAARTVQGRVARGIVEGHLEVAFVVVLAGNVVHPVPKVRI